MANGRVDAIAFVIELRLGFPRCGDEQNSLTTARRKSKGREQSFGERIARATHAEIGLPAGKQNTQRARNTMQRVLWNHMRRKGRTAAAIESCQCAHTGNSPDE